jgi:hypothetical protein
MNTSPIKHGLSLHRGLSMKFFIAACAAACAVMVILPLETSKKKALKIV